MSELLTEFLSEILTEEQAIVERNKSPEDEKFDSTIIKYSYRDKRTGKQVEDEATIKTIKTRGSSHPAWPKYQQLLQARQKTQKANPQQKKVGVATQAQNMTPTKQPVSQQNKSQTQTPQKKPSSNALTAQTAPKPQSPPNIIVRDLRKSNKTLSDARRKGVPGPGGAVASYGEVGLTDAANEFSGGGLKKFNKTNARTIEKYSKEIAANPKKFKRVMEVVSKQLGFELPQDEKEVLHYLGSRRAYEDQELSRLKKDKKGVFYMKTGFKGNEEDARAWARAQYDGAISTIELVEHNSKIDPKKPFTVIQSEAIEGGHDTAIKQHLEQKLQQSKGADDKAHYQSELDSFNKLGFHDTMVVGLDKKGRMSVYHISNKKNDDLIDIWNNTTPAKAIEGFKESILEKLSGADDKVTQGVLKTMEQGVTDVSESEALAAGRFLKMKFDNDFVKAIDAVRLGKLPKIPKKDYVGDIVDKKPFQKWLKDNKIKPPKSTSGRLLAIQKYSADLKKNGKPIPSAVSRLMTKVAEVMPKLQQTYGEKFGSKSSAIKTAMEVKEAEKDILGVVHKKIVDSLTKADAKLGYGKDPSKGNGPHMKAYIGSVMHSMHYDIMITNYDESLGAVTGIRGSTPSDFRETLSELSDYDGEITTPEGREGLMKHLLKTSKLNPTTKNIEISGISGTHVLATDSWRTAGKSKKIEKKVGDSVREGVMSNADYRRAERRKKGKKK